MNELVEKKLKIERYIKSDESSMRDSEEEIEQLKSSLKRRKKMETK